MIPDAGHSTDYVVTDSRRLNFIEAQCVAKGMRMTEQRRVIARVLADSADHPDVEELYRRCAEIDERISISTVYRTVKLFEDAGIIERHDFREGRARYEQIPDEHHDHLINLRTGEVIEFQSEEIERLQARGRPQARLQAGRSPARALRRAARRREVQTLMLRLMFVVAAFALVTLPLMPVQWLAVALKRPLRRRIPVFYHRFLCRLLGIRVHVIGAPVDARPLLIVANHSSWLDISVITSLAPVVFVAKSEIARWPLFGLLAKLQRSVFVERDRRHKTGEVNAEIAQRLAEGDPVLLFGEGTAGDGNRVLPFRTALIGAARDALAAANMRAQVWIQPLSIAYVSQQGIPLGRHLRPRAAWYGKMELVPHIGRIARTARSMCRSPGASRSPTTARPTARRSRATGSRDPRPYGRGPARNAARPALRW